jgi:hypothetical protein
MFDDLATTNFDSLPTKGREVSFTEKCYKCRGTGTWVSRSGYTQRTCFKCKGKGFLEYKTSPQARAKSRAYSAKRSEAQANEKAVQGAKFLEQHGLVDWIAETKDWNNFARSLRDSAVKYGKLTDGQLAAAIKSADKHFAKKEERAKAESKNAVAINAEGLKPVMTAFDTAKSNGLKRPKMRLDGFALSLAPAHGKNAGSIYVKNGDQYLGKISPEGQFVKPYSLDAETAADIDAKLIELGNNPMEAAVAYGKRTGECSCCGRTLTNAESIERGIGPICAEKFGF